MQHMAQAREEEEATQENHHSQSDEEGRWSTQSTRGSSSSRSETARSHSHDSSDIREPAARHVARRLSRMRINDEVSTRYDGDDEGAGAEQSSSLRDLKLYPLPPGMVPTRKRSFGTMLKDDGDSPQDPDKLSRELDAMMRPPYVPQHDDEIPMFTPRSVPSGSRSLVTRSSTTREQGDTQAGSPSSRKRQESGTVYAAPSAPARAP